MLSNKSVVLILSFITSFFFAFFCMTYKLAQLFKGNDGVTEFYWEAFVNTAHYYIIGPIIHLYMIVPHNVDTIKVISMILSYILLLAYIISFTRKFLKTSYSKSKKKSIFYFILMFLGVLAWCLSGVFVLVLQMPTA